MSVCILCPRKCGVDREIMRGYCQSGGKMHIARAKLHYWEEPPISGTVSYTHLTLPTILRV